MSKRKKKAKPKLRLRVSPARVAVRGGFTSSTTRLRAVPPRSWR